MGPRCTLLPCQSDSSGFPAGFAIRTDKGVTIDGVKVINTDFHASNGITPVIDTLRVAGQQIPLFPGRGSGHGPSQEPES